ncbi:helix-hairpin-helix domain-containing protein [Nocardioides sp. HM23]|uniref:helix-hairpin-helix domain-containing protein n=1 Tax=Nocardioides bizhenqiangii TaxID=3095076 RepID=UPI002ACABA42|nr:helix-hairpin-helix domain-containing protein [Nocardioides sp. HM23]MDZ5623207.1 helix-hairpin-helix domain-containing protein [Nocardioides sp. HM23]
MRSTRGSSGSEPSRAERADAAARRLALLAADLGAADPDPRSTSWPPPDADFTRVVPSRRAVSPAPDPVEPAERLEPPVVPRPGRHAARRRPGWAAPRTTGFPGLGAPQVTVLAVLVAAGVALTAWWVVRDQAAPVAPGSAAPPSTAAPLVATAPGTDPTGASPADAGGTVTVDVTGKVRRPGIVVLDTGARVVDALDAAGGERAGVDLSSLNLARVLVDGEQIVVGAPQPPPPVATSGATAPGAPAALVNLNTATQAELETLPDVGPVTALAILAWRDQHGGFTSVDELLEVDGIGETTLETLTPYVTV